MIDVEKKVVYTKHESHVTRGSDASTYDEICINCGATDAPGSWRGLADPCKGGKPALTTAYRMQLVERQVARIIDDEEHHVFEVEDDLTATSEVMYEKMRAHLQRQVRLGAAAQKWLDRLDRGVK